MFGLLAGVLLLAGGGFAGYWLLSDDAEDPQVTAAQERLRPFLLAWQKDRAERAGTYTDSPSEAESLIDSVMTNLKPSSTKITAGSGELKDKGEVRVPFTVAMRIPGVGAYDWKSEARVLKRSGKWTVAFTTPMIHPEMRPGQTLALSGGGDRAKILDRKGDELRAASLTGVVDGKSGKGVSGLEARYDDRLAGGKGPRKAVVVADRGTGKAAKTLSSAKRAKGRPVKTTIDPRVQQAAADALSGVKKKAAVVAVDPRNGHILAAANKPGGANRALTGRYAPGSTFKVVTTAALLDKGLRPSDPAPCPKYEHVNGQRFENQDTFTLPKGSTFREAFAQSCNTFFVGARDKLSNSSLRETSQAFGIGGKWDVGTSTYDGSVPVNESDNDKAASVIGQGRVQASPLVMASLAATVKNGTFQQPVLVPDAVREKYRAPKNLDPKVVADLRTLMRATVTSGSGKALKGLPGEPHAKTGTAEFGTEKPPRTHAWMIGYQGGSPDLAWAVLLEDGGSGGSDAGPVAAKFLKGLG
ncbi:penicillin-binding transpeptidase domain-containing protein [Streptomyces iconiensis]|uniref:Penicillin-binding transpeptidase domain-containing protein n=1 Tax=Streptomyces iconiensis TaxID=1384038 RepID=A0ABT6ZVY1_9ACTN|nr:penicillin-binding transpeptidase domain-containing protein [Streptomyces iconiensis]MDJ1132987.1 penicillin-binding transpeptidase domain-containing protein [Streptomyces iconiensis]